MTSLMLKRDADSVRCSLFQCQTLIDYSWEFLNTNIWTFVENKWRYVYAYATLYKAIFLKYHLNPADEDASSGDKIVKLCDMGIASIIMPIPFLILIKSIHLGLLMSGPLLEKQFDTVIKYFRASRPSSSSKTKLECASSDTQTTNKRPKLELNTNEEFRLKVENSPTVERFAAEYFNPHVPVIIDGQMSHWPAVKKWG